tara:strand:+ start:2053 stop:2793 length:741 start_codon:yes stop_codon:yes gene_type:complete
MHRYQILIEYVGTNFYGWQSQKKLITIQGTIEKVLKKTLKEKIKLYGSGRTDTEVHAIEQSAHFDVRSKITNIKKFYKTLNFFLNQKFITIVKINKKPLTFHARHSAKKRIYKYLIYNRESLPSLDRDRGWYVRKKLDCKLIKKASHFLKGKHDLSVFRASNCSASSPLRTINSLTIKKNNDIIEIKIKSRSFLKQQVRSIVGCLKYVGEKKWTIKKFKEIVKSRNRKLCAPPAPGTGLYLERVIY